MTSTMENRRRSDIAILIFVFVSVYFGLRLWVSFDMKNAITLIPIDKNGATIESSYVIGFDDCVANLTERVRHLQSLIPELEIRCSFPELKAIAVTNVSTKRLRMIQLLTNVTYIEPDHTVEAMRVERLKNSTLSWGIDRIDGKLDSKYQYSYTGKGVRVYVIDSGIQSKHDEFRTMSNKDNVITKRRAKCGKNLRKDLGENCNDLWGHGTHVAAIIGGKTYGVAKDVDLVAVKVFGSDGKSRFSDIVAALEYVIYQKSKEPKVPMVINMSLGTERKAMLLNKAVEKAVKVGIPVIVAAGNGGKNACSYSPASSTSVIAVAASTIEDYRLSYSNWGRCVDIYAPGDSIWSAWSGKRSAGSFQTGTSSAAAYVSGTVALYLERNRSMTPQDIKEALQKDATIGVLRNETQEGKFLPSPVRKETPNLLLNVDVFRKTLT